MSTPPRSPTLGPQWQADQNGSSGGSPSVVTPGGTKTKRRFVHPTSPQRVIKTSQYAYGHGQTPVSLLNHFAERNKLTLSFALESESGPAHALQATFKVSIGAGGGGSSSDMCGRGTAATHREAKQRAAEALWKKLKNNTPGKGTIYSYLYK